MDAAAIITLTRAVRHALTVESFESLRDALFRLPGLQSAAPVLAGKVPAPGAACVSALDAAVDQVADRELSPSSRSYTVAELYAALYEDDDAGPGEALTERDFFRRQHAFIAQRDDFSPPVKTMLAELLAHLARQYGARR